MLILLLLVVLVPMLATQWVLYRERLHNRRHEEEQANLELARAVARAFEGYLADIVHQELAIATVITSTGGRHHAAIHHVLVASAAEYPAVTHYAWLDGAGRVVDSSAPPGTGLRLDGPRLLASVRTHTWAPSSLGEGPLRTPTFAVSRAMRDGRGRLQGAVVAVLDPRRLGPVLVVRRAESGAISIVDSAGRIAYRYPDPPLIGISLRYLAVRAALSGREAVGAWYSRVDDKLHMGAAVPVGQTGWVATASRPEALVLGRIWRGTIQDAIVFLGVALLAAVVAWALAERIAIPLRFLRRQALAVGKGGDPGPPLQVGPSEVREVSAAFASMAANIQQRERQRDEDLQAIVQGQLALAESEQRYRAIGELLPYGIWITDRDGGIQYLSDSFLQMAGRTLEQCRGFDWLDLVPPEERERNLRDWQQCVQTGTLWDYEHHLRGADGEYRTVLSRGVPLRDERGEVVSWVGVHLDITARKQAEQERERLLQEVAEASRRNAELAEQLAREREILSTIMDNTRTHLAYLDSDFNFVAINDAYEQGCGHTRAELLGRNHFHFFPNAENEAIFRRVVVTGEPVVYEAKPFEFVDQPQRGITYWDWTLVPVHDGDGGVSGLVFSLQDVTERIRAQQERERLLAEIDRQRQWLAALIENVPAGILVLGSDLRVKWSNAAYRLLLEPEFHQADLRGRHLEDFIPQARAVGLTDIFAEVAATGKPVAIDEYEYNGFSRGTTWWRWSLLPLPQPGGGPPDLMLLAAEITDQVQGRKQVEALAAQLERERALLEAVLQQMPSGLFVAEAPSGRLILANEQAARIWGRPTTLSESVAGYGDYQGFHPDGRPYAPEEWPLARSLQGEVVAGEEIAFTRGDGSQGVMEVSSAPIRGREGEIAAAVVIFSDITERRRAQADLERERAFLSSAIELLPFPIFFADPQGHIVRSNLSDANDSHEGRRWSDLVLADPYTQRAPAPEQHPLQRALRGGLTVAAEWLARSPEGTQTPVLLHAAPVYVGDEVVAAVVAMQDVSALKAADHAKDEFLAVLSHELLTPITSIIGWTQWALKGGQPALAEEALAVIARNACRQKRLVDDLLDVSRILHGRIALNPEPAQLGHLLRQEVDSLRPLAQEHQLTLDLDECAPDLPVVADPARLRQVIANLLGNAIKYTPAGGRITASARRVGANAVLAVADTGRGIPGEELSHVFDPFRQVQRDEAVGGLGLGLALVRGLVELQGGRVEAASPGLGQGSTFTVTFPLQAEPATAPTPPAA